MFAVIILTHMLCYLHITLILIPELKCRWETGALNLFEITDFLLSTDFFEGKYWLFQKSQYTDFLPTAFFSSKSQYLYFTDFMLKVSCHH